MEEFLDIFIFPIMVGVAIILSLVLVQYLQGLRARRQEESDHESSRSSLKMQAEKKNGKCLNLNLLNTDKDDFQRMEIALFVQPHPDTNIHYFFDKRLQRNLVPNTEQPLDLPVVVDIWGLEITDDYNWFGAATYIDGDRKRRILTFENNRRVSSYIKESDDLKGFLKEEFKNKEISQALDCSSRR